jgi:prevent-host-death family protein
MKVVPLAKAKNELSTYVEQAQASPVLVTRHGKPAALLIGVEGEALEDLITQADPEFWAMIESRRRESRPAPAAEVRNDSASDAVRSRTRVHVPQGSEAAPDSRWRYGRTRLATASFPPPPPSARH